MILCRSRGCSDDKDAKYLKNGMEILTALAVIKHMAHADRHQLQAHRTPIGFIATLLNQSMVLMLV